MATVQIRFECSADMADELATAFGENEGITIRTASRFQTVEIDYFEDVL